MQTYLVGGAVRDALLGLAVKDRDWVVVGASPELMTAQGFEAVGRDFPVFLHPKTHEEYALARTERKTAPGYRGFVVHTAPDVTHAIRCTSNWLSDPMAEIDSPFFVAMKRSIAAPPSRFFPTNESAIETTSRRIETSTVIVDMAYFFPFSSRIRRTIRPLRLL